MSHVSLYRKYRPQIWDEVIGQDHIVNGLRKAIESGKISHAYLFSGSRGTGKTSVARIFAAKLGTSPNDIYEIDAASYRGINEMKELLSGINTLPFDSKYKVYILDEAHQLTKEASNALLKNLEEPPAHVIFILATTESHKILDTIKSRCQIFEFQKASTTFSKNLIQAIAKEEKVSIEDDAAELIAKRGDGAYRDTVGILEQVIQSSTSKKITLSDVERILKAPHHELVHEFVKNLVDKKLPECIETLHTVHDEGHSIEHFLENVLHQCRLVLLHRFAPTFAETVATEFSEVVRNDSKLWAKEKNIINAQLLVEFLTLLEEVKKSSIPYIPVELALMRILDNHTTI